MKVRGPKGTPVVLTIERGGEAPRDIEIVRAVIVTPEVESEDLADGTVGYIRLSGFSDHAAEQFDDAVAEDVAAGRKKLILDLRGNPGGFVTAARDIASQFLADGTIFWEEDADGTLVETAAKPGGAAVDRRRSRLVVLVDGGSASASEIVAGALHDRGPRDARRHEDVRQGHRPAVDPARGRPRRLPADDRQVADAGQDLGPRRGDHAGRRGGRAAGEARRRPRARRRARGARRRRLSDRTRNRRLRASAGSGTVALERKEVMCSDRQSKLLHHLVGDRRLVAIPTGGR